MFFKNTVFVIALFCAVLTNAQECNFTLKGAIIDFHDGQRLEAAQLYIRELNIAAVTSATGTYEFKDLCAGSYTIYITHIDCEPKQLTVKLSANKQQDIFLEHHIDQLQAIKIIADVHDDHQSTQSSTRIKQETLQEFRGATLGDALETVQGVTALKTGNSVVKPVIHGLYGSRVAIVNNGLRLQDQEWGVEHAPNIDVNAINTIQVIKGASALRYGGDAVGGTIVLEPARFIKKDTIKGSVTLQGQSNGRGGTITSQLDRYRKSGWYQHVTATAKRLGDFEAPDYVLSNTGSETRALHLTTGYESLAYGASVTYNYYDARIGILRASHIGSAADLVRSINAGQPFVVNDFTYAINAPRQEVVHHALQASAYKRFSGVGKLTALYSFQLNNRLEFDIRRGANANRAALDIDLQTQIAALHMLIDVLPKTTIEMGIDGAYQVNRPNPDTGVRRLIPDYTSVKAGGFASVLYKPSDVWILDAGLRYDHFMIDASKFYIQSRWESLGYNEQYPQFEVAQQGNQILTNPVFNYDLLAFTAGAKRVFNEHYDVALNLSTANRAPNPSELFSDGLHHALATIELGRLDLKMEQSFKLNAIFHANVGKLDLEINPHINRINDFIQLIPTGVETTTRGAFPVFQYEQVNAQIAGIVLSAGYDFWTRKTLKQNGNSSELTYDVVKMAHIDSRFSYLHGQNLTMNEPLIDMPPVQFTNRLTFYNVWKKLDVYVANQTVLEQARFPDYDYEAPVPQNDGSFVNETVRISQPPGSYSLWDVGISYEKKQFLGTQGAARVSLVAQNLLNTTYRNYLNRQRFYADEVGRNFNVQLNYHF